MDCHTGRIYTPEELEKKFGIIQSVESDMEAFNQQIKKMQVPPTQKQLSRKPPKVDRNEPCPCGSGKKFKHCCLITD